MTVQLAVLPLPSLAVAVMVAVPAAMPVTVPPEVTVATEVLLLDQVTVLFSAFEGLTVAERVSEAPTSMVVEALFREMEVTFIAVHRAIYVVLAAGMVEATVGYHPPKV